MATLQQRFNNEPSEQYTAVVNAVESLIVSEGGDRATRAYAQAISEPLAEAYARSHGWKRRNSTHVCIRRLTGKSRCPNNGRVDCDVYCYIPRADHLIEWVKGGKTVAITSEPYGISGKEAAELYRFCESNGLTYQIDADSFYFPHRTILIVISRESDDEAL
jgi:hypothetical protein